MEKGHTHLCGKFNRENCENSLRNRNTLASMSYRKYFKIEQKNTHYFLQLIK